MHATAAPPLLLAALERYERPLLRYALHFLHDAEEARDVVQDVFIRLSQHLSQLDEERLAAWLFTVCKNRALDHQRKHSRLIVMENEAFDHEASPAPQPGDLMQSRETAAALRSMIETLPARQREAVMLKFISGLDYKEISQVMKTSIGNVGYLIHHGVQSLRTRWLEAEAQAELPCAAHP
ncbi:MAG: sigma-70 family RNA polymerase sigma factor [Prosthecobacter sp.]|nr:sigma-70 family RNA polymerase sigma factor [Prosthecobacter sp.]